MIPTSRIRHPLQRGYSLIEMAVVLAIIGTVTGGALVLGNAHEESGKAKTTKQRLDRIEKAIQLHAYAGGYLPCPAIPTAPENTVTFGVSDDCSQVAPADPSILQVGTGTNEEIWIGAVPTRSLNLSDEDMVDGWNNRFTYAVVKNLAIDVASFEAFSTSSSTSVIEITDAAGIQIPDADTVVAYAVISHGKDGKGARNRLGAQTAACATTGLDKENCDATDTFMDSRITDSVTAANYYDDMIRWKQMNFMQQPAGADDSGSDEDSFIAVGAGDGHACALKSDGTVWCWGYNANGELGDGTTTTRPSPVQVSGLTNVQEAAFSDGHACVIKSDRTVWCWGDNTGGQIGDGTTTDRLTPVSIAFTNVRSIHASHTRTCAVKTDGTAWCWGANREIPWANWLGGIGDNTSTNRSTPTQVSGLTGVDTMGVGEPHACAVKTDDTLWCWGGNHWYGGLGDAEGFLGDGTNTDRLVPVQSGITNVLQVSGGAVHTCAIKNDGTAWCWGDSNVINAQGMVGDGTTNIRLSPVQVSGLTGATQINAGNWHSCALKNDGTVWCWGTNKNTWDGANWGTLGDGTYTNRLVPVQVSGLTNATAVDCGASLTCAIKDGTVWCWGDNGAGQLGIGTIGGTQNTPVQVVFP